MTFRHLLIAAPLFLFSANAQLLTVTGRLLDATDKSPLVGANVVLTSAADSMKRVGAMTDTKGSFTIPDVRPGAWHMVASYVGYDDLAKTLTLRAGSEKLGTMTLTQSAVRLKEVVIESTISPVEQKGDTTQFNAGSFKVNPDATAEDLVAKMPGITVDKSTGTVKAQGETIQKVLVDNKPFFGDDPTVAMRNLPADMIDKVQVYDKLSDQAQLTGFDDGNREKTLNIITRLTRRSGEFGRAYAGYGTEDRYSAGGSFNLFRGDTRVSILGLTNNVNQQNFSIEDLIGASGFAPRAGMIQRIGGGQAALGMIQRFGGGGGIGGLLVGQSNGLNTTNSIGANYGDQFSNTLEVNASYFFNNGINRNTQLTDREYFLKGDASQYYTERSAGDNRNYNHRFNSRIEYTPDTLNTVILTPRFSFQTATTGNLTVSDNASGGAALSASSSLNSSDANAWNGSGSLTYRHRFETRGRSLSATFSASGNNRDGNVYLDAFNTYYGMPIPQADTINQKTISSTNGYSVSADVAYTEPLGPSGMIQANYSANYSDNTADKRAWEYDYALQQYGILEPGLSSVLDNQYVTQRGGIGYRLRGEDGWNAFAQLNWQYATLAADQTYPSIGTVDRGFRSWLPSAQFDWHFSQTGNVRINYRASTTPPSVNQLQRVVDNSNPLLLTAGNPDLTQDMTHTLFVRYGQTSMKTMTGFFVFLYGAMTNNYIGNATSIALQDTTYAGGITVPRGAQLTMPVNLDGFRSLRSFLTYSFPVGLISSNLTLTGGLTYARTPGMTNNAASFTNTYGISAGTVVSSNISQNLDFTVSYFGNQNIIRNTFRPDQNSDYYSHAAGVRLNWIFWEGFLIRSDITHQFTNGLGKGIDQNFLLWNASFGKKLFSDDSGELTLSVFDILKQNKSVIRNATESYVEDVRPTVLNQYFLLTFTYTLKNFAGGMGPGPGRDHDPGHWRDHDH